MTTVTVKVHIKTAEGAILPHYQTAGAAGADLHALLPRPWRIDPGDTVLVPTGLFVEIPPGYEGQVRPRSGLAFKHHVTVLNSPGTIDCDYRGEVGVLLQNTSGAPFIVQNGDRIAQLVVKPVPVVEFVEVDELSVTVRGEGGLGSTGISQ